ncbi:hypothetical protein BGW42_007044, partial [Actinomortierella wolfii]
RGFDGETPLASSIEEMTLDYIDQIRRIQLHGPYSLLRWSFGGNVAHNIASKLEQCGDKVQLLVIMDSLADVSALAIGSIEEEKRVSVNEISRSLAAAMGFDGKLDMDSLRRRVLVLSTYNRRLLKCHSPPVAKADIIYLRAAIIGDVATKLVELATWKPLTRSEAMVHEIQYAHEDMNKPEHIAVIGHVIHTLLDMLQQLANFSRSIEF